MKLRDVLKKNLTEKEMECLKTAFDQIGTIAIMEIPPELEAKERFIGMTLIEMNKNIKTVVKKSGAHSGELRLRSVAHLAGDRTTTTTHKESGCEFTLDIEKVYFSVRLGTERLRIANLITKDEEVLAMFSGCCPYPIIISKNSPAKGIVAVELNEAGHEFAKINIEKNRIKNVTLKQGDVREIIPKLKKKFDRILMPLPKSAEDFLDVALGAIKSGGVIHFYDFIPEEAVPAASIEKIDAACSLAKKDYRILGWTRCGTNAPHQWRICVDVQIL